MSEDEWEQCLTSLLRPGALLAGNLDVTAQLRDEDTLIIKVEKKVLGHKVCSPFHYPFGPLEISVQG